MAVGARRPVEDAHGDDPVLVLGDVGAGQHPGDVAYHPRVLGEVAAIVARHP